MGTETLKPLLPSCLYSTLVLSIDSWTDLGMAAMLAAVVAIGFVPRDCSLYQKGSVLMLCSCARAGAGGFL